MRILNTPSAAATPLCGMAARASQAMLAALGLTAFGLTTFGAHAEAPAAAPEAEPAVQVDPTRAWWHRQDPRSATAPLSARSETVARVLRAQPRVLENPCVQHTPAGLCTKTALDGFFARVDAHDAAARGEARAEQAPARVLWIGNSLTASDHITDVLRARLKDRLGDAGQGFLYADLLTKGYGRRNRTGRAQGMALEVIGVGAPADVPYGIGGGHHRTTSRWAKATWRLKGERSARFVLGAPAGGADIEVRVDGRRVHTAHTAAGRVSVPVRLPAGGKTLSLRVKTAGTRVYGVDLLKDAPGATLDTHAVVATDGTMWLGIDADAVAAEVRARKPALNVVMLGGNEVRRLAWKKRTATKIHDDHKALLLRLKAAAPDAGCLAIGPLESMLAEGGVVSQRPETHVVRRALRTATLEAGCAYMDMYDVMGGAGAIQRLARAKMMHGDMVHPRRQALDAIGAFIAEALFDTWRITPPAGLPRPHATLDRHFAGMSDAAGLAPQPRASAAGPVQGAAGAPHALARFVQKLADLEAGKRDRVAIGMFGASHTAGHKITDPVRAGLAARYGERGRGYVSVGRPSDLLLPGGITRALTGRFRILDGRETPRGTKLSMAGVATELWPGATARVGFAPMPSTAHLRATPDGAKATHGAAADAGQTVDRSVADASAIVDSTDGGPVSPRGPCAGVESIDGTITVAWMNPRQTGKAEVWVDGEHRADLVSEPDQVGEVQFLRMSIHGETHDVQIRVPPVAPDADARPIADADPAADDVAARGDASADDAGAPLFTDLGADPEALAAAGTPSVAVLSVTQEMWRPGIVLDPVALPGTTAMHWQDWHAPTHSAQVSDREYDLVILGWGTNESAMPHLSEARYRQKLNATITQMRAAAPGADCMFFAATDVFVRQGRALVPGPSLALVDRVQRDVAAAHNCAYYAPGLAMGGPGSMKRWIAEGLGHRDHTHFTKPGYDKVAQTWLTDWLALIDAHTQAAAWAAADAPADPVGPAAQTASEARTGAAGDAQAAVPTTNAATHQAGGAAAPRDVPAGG